MSSLSHDQITAFRSSGYLVVEDVLDARLLDDLKAEYTALLDGLYAVWMREGRVRPDQDLDFWTKLLVAYRAGCDWFQPMDISLPGDRIQSDTPFHIGPAVFDLLTTHRILDIVEDLIGPEIMSNPIQHVRLKPPANQLLATEVRAHVGGTDWHQDRGVAHESADRTDMITVWVAMTDATIENGCLIVLPKTAEQQMLPHCPKTQTAIADGFIDEDGAIPTPVSAGGIVLLDPLTPHTALPNVSKNFRWSFDLRYHVTGQNSGREHFPSFVARSREDPASELRDWRALRDMWNETRDRLAGAPHIPLHRWESGAPFCA